MCKKKIETISRKMKSGQVVIHQVEEAKESDSEEEIITFIPCVVCNRDTDWATNLDFDTGGIDFACACCYKKAICEDCYKKPESRIAGRIVFIDEDDEHWHCNACDLKMNEDLNVECF